MSDTIIERNGKVTRYGLACGYVESYDARGRIRDFYLTDADATRLSFNGATYDVHTRIQGVTFDGDFPRRIDGVRADWEQYETLTEARKAIQRNRERLASIGSDTHEKAEVYACFDCWPGPLNERQAAEHAREYRHCVTDTSDPASAPCNGFCRRADH